MTFLQCITRMATDLKSKFAAIVHTHTASDITSGTLGVARGGTGGTTALDARKNLAVPVDSSIAYVESTTAQANHAVGDYFMLGSVLMRATAAIAAGETINASKATPATVQGQIDTLRDSVDRKGSTVVGVLFSSTPTNGNYHAILPLRGNADSVCNITHVTLVTMYQSGLSSSDFPAVSNFNARILWNTLDIYTPLESVKGQFCAFKVTLN